MKKLLCLAALAVGTAFADVVPTLDISSAGITCGAIGGPGSEIQCTYRYTASIEKPTFLRPAGDSAFTQYFTIYDFNGYVAGSAVAAAGFTVSPSTLTPSKITPDNEPGIPDITFAYTGSGMISGGTTIAGFSLRSVFGPGTQMADYTSVSTLAVTSRRGTTYEQAQSTSRVLVPNNGEMPNDAVPEPMSMGLLGGGLAALALLPSRFRKRN